ncbi:MAG: hypothetical protein A2505_03350 [Deltaproteobacteria bacterium RIFOXYD12_FULL_55_16]|nr:MAG: hypothetical protein A2505_03350 [Deltaproteobacteria bacterium RIFOXYD12_FULL_55_16]
MGKQCNRQYGFTLVEVLVAMAVLTIGILGVFAMQISSVGGNNLAVRITRATTWADDTVETLMTRAYSHADLVDDSGNGILGLNDTDAAGSLADGGPVTPLVNGLPGDYTIFWNVADDTPLTDCKTIRVIVRRSDNGVVRTVSFDYLKAKDS